MKAKEVKILLIKKGLTISDMARELESESDAGFDSLRTMLTDLLYGRRFFPTLAAQVEEKFGIKIEREPHHIAVREAIKNAA